MKRSLAIFLSVVLLAVLGARGGAGQEQHSSSALAALVEAERAFARLSVARGVREAFMTYFADDGINFQPHPTNTKEAYRQRPAPAAPPPITLDWQPIYADVSAAGDLGYTTGPYTLTDRGPAQRPAQHGYYFSLWRKQADGAWKVVVDCGIQTPAPPPLAPAPMFQPPRHAQSKVRGDVNLEAERVSLLATDSALLAATAAGGVARALGAQLTNDARLHRMGLFPIVGRTAVRAYLKGREMALTGAPIKADVAQSGDLGYTYGSYVLRDGGRTEKGYYVRVWRREGGRWRVALDTANPLPPETQQ